MVALANEYLMMGLDRWNRFWINRNGSIGNGKSGDNFGDGSAQPFRLDGLDKVIQRVHVKCLERIFIVGGGKYHQRGLIEPLQQLKAVVSGHLDIEENQVGRVFGDGGQRFLAVGAFADQLNLGFTLQ